MRKSILCLLIVFLIAGAIFIFNNKIGEEYIKNSDDLYDIAINYLVEEENKSRTFEDVEGFKVFANYDKFGVTKKGEYKYVYMWVLLDSYGLKDNVLQDLGGYSIFHKFTFKDNEVVDYETPEDGSRYTSSIKKMCSDKKMVRKVLNYDLAISNEKEVHDYYFGKSYEFTAKILEVKDDYIMVETLEDSDMFEANETLKVYVNKLLTDSLYVVDNEVKITFNGNVDSSEPAQIGALKVEEIK